MLDKDTNTNTIRQLVTCIEGLASQLGAVAGFVVPSVEVRRTSREHATAALAFVKKLEGVAFMPVPRCDGCKHWDKDVSDKDRGQCMKVYGHDDTKMWPDLYDGVNTTADFGCVQWESK
jgi:hypothetical protein